MAVEVALLVRFGRLGPLAIVTATLPGAMIVVALRFALVGAAWPWIALPLMLAWPAHLWDLHLRARRGSVRSTVPLLAPQLPPQSDAAHRGR